MSQYRLYFLDAKGAIEAREEFVADDDDAALCISGLLWDACSETYAGCDLWSYGRHVRLMHTRAGIGLPPEREEISLARQQVVLNVENALQRSHWRVAKSRRLLEATANMRDILAIKKDEEV